MTQARSAIVVGGGLIGCFSAYYLARGGCQVTLLERSRIGSGASSGNCGYVCPSHVLPLAGPGVILPTLRQMTSRDAALVIRLRALPAMLPWLLRFVGRCREEPRMIAAHGRHALLTSSMQLYRQLVAEEVLDCEWQEKGLLTVYRSPRHFEQFEATATLLHREFGLTVTPYGQDELHELEPALQPGLAGGWLFPDDTQVRPDKLMETLRRALNRLGVEIREGVTVRSLVIDRGRLTSIATSDGSRTADVAVIAAGAETPLFARSLQCRIPIQPAKGYSLTMPAGKQTPSIPMIFEQHHVAVTPFQGALRIGSTMEFAGYDRSINRARTDLLIKSARAHLVEVPDVSGIDAWAGWRPLTYDGLPTLSTAPGASNVVVAAGNGMIGLASAPATGKLAAEIATGAVAHLDPAPYSLARF